MGIILTSEQHELIDWFWCQHRTIAEIAAMRRVSYATVRRQIDILRAIVRSHGQELPRFNRGRPRLTPNLVAEAVI